MQDEDQCFVSNPGSLTRTSDIAVVLHLRSVDVWDDGISPRLLTFRGQVRYDLFVSLPEAYAAFASTIVRDFPAAKVFIAKGDPHPVFPFMKIAGRLAADGYRFVLRLVSERRGSEERMSPRLSDSLGALLPPDKGAVQDILTKLEKDDTGLIGFCESYSGLVFGSGAGDIELLNEILRNGTTEYSRYEQLRDRNSLGFFSDGMFWARIDAIHSSLELPSGLGEADGNAAERSLGRAIDRALVVLPELDQRAVFTCNGLAVHRLNHASAAFPLSLGTGECKGVESKPTITVIIPCFNVVGYLDACVKSVLKQTYGNLRILLIDDGSTDGTGEVVSAYAERYAHTIKAVRNEENRGAGFCRNLGLSMTTTEEVAFIDADDWIPAAYFEKMHYAIASSGADVAVCELVQRKFRLDVPPPEDQNEHGWYQVITSPLAASSTNKLFKTSLFDGLAYPEGIMNEDVSVIIPILSKARVEFVTDTYYNYYQRDGSTQNSYSLKRLDIFEALLIARNRMESIPNNVWDATVFHQVVDLLLWIAPRFPTFTLRRQFMRGFYENASRASLGVFDNPLLEDVRLHSTLMRLYVNSLLWALSRRLFGLSAFVSVFGSRILGFQGATGYRWLRACFRAIRHPRRFASRVLRTCTSIVKSPHTFWLQHFRDRTPKNIIKRDISINDLIASAEGQRAARGPGKVSVVIPNFNYGRFLLERIFSILSQTVAVGEILVLDDASSDGSVELVEDIIESIGEIVNVRLITNSINVGPFRQWERGFKEAWHDFVWIAEADDYCDCRFLEEVLRPFENERVVLSYCDTAFVDSVGAIVLATIKPEIDVMKTGHWAQSFTNVGISENRDYVAVNCTIANVSSALFRKVVGVDFAGLFNQSGRFSQVGDWLFYFNYLLLGDVAYVDQVLNYYRLHGNNVSSVTERQTHFDEMKVLHQHFIDVLDLQQDARQRIVDREEFVKRVWGVT